MAEPLPKPPDDFGTFIMRKGDRLVSFFIDLALKEVAPDPALPLRLTATAQVRHPSDAGFPVDEEAQMLWSLEERLLVSLFPMKRIRYLGRTSTDGKRTFYFQAAETEPLKEAAAFVKRQQPAYSLELRVKEDPDWTTYLRTLYPPLVEFQRTQSLKVREALQADGDANHLPREVEHFLDFETEAARDASAAAAEELGFTAERLEAPSPGELTEGGEGFRRTPWTLRCTRVQTADQEAIDAACDPLVRLAEEHQGVYDGWGCLVTKPSPLARILGRFRRGG